MMMLRGQGSGHVLSAGRVLEVTRVVENSALVPKVHCAWGKFRKLARLLTRRMCY